MTASVNEAATEVYIKAVNTSAERAIRATVEIAGVADRLSGRASVPTITAPRLDTANSFSEPKRIRPSETDAAISGSALTHEFPKHSVTVIRVPVS